MTRTMPGHDCRARTVLDRIGDKWSIQVISQLGDGVKRFTDLKRNSYGVSQRMLTVTVRGLERDGIVTRTVYPVVPPRVEYELTPLGHTLLATICDLLRWAEANVDSIEKARMDYDQRTEPASVP
jgi:DNA-binding HxlR family transcriptional regulator